MAVLAKVRDDKLFLCGGALLSVLEKCITCCELCADCAKRELPLPSPPLLLLLLEPRTRGLVCLACASMRLLLCLLAVPVSIIIVVVVKNECTRLVLYVMAISEVALSEEESESLMPSLDGWL